MEYLRGASLAKLTRRAAAASVPLGAQLLTALLRGFCHGLHAVHEKGIVHCDVSPQNLLVTFDGRAKVIDFGVARAVGNRMAQEDGPLRGKLGYLAPEQLAGETLDRRCDVFALGVVAYELLAGQEPGSVRESIRRYTPGGFPALVEVNPRVPGPLAEAVGRAVMIDPAARLPSCEAFSEALEKALEKCRLAAAEPADVAALMRDLFGDHEAALKRLLAGPQGTDTGDKVKTFRLDGE